MGELDLLDCVYCGEAVHALPTLNVVPDGKELVYNCACGGTFVVELEG